MKKYELLENDFVEVNGKKLFRIRALKDFGYVKKGDLGGYIENESNLSHKGDCWVDENAKVYENAQVYGNAVVDGNAQVYGNADVCGSAQVLCHADVSGYALIC